MGDTYTTKGQGDVLLKSRGDKSKSEEGERACEIPKLERTGVVEIHGVEREVT